MPLRKAFTTFTTADDRFFYQWKDRWVRGAGFTLLAFLCTAGGAASIWLLHIDAGWWNVMLQFLVIALEVLSCMASGMIVRQYTYLPLSEFSIYAKSAYRLDELQTKAFDRVVEVVFLVSKIHSTAVLIVAIAAFLTILILQLPMTKKAGIIVSAIYAGITFVSHAIVFSVNTYYWINSGGTDAASYVQSAVKEYKRSLRVWMLKEARL